MTPFGLLLQVSESLERHAHQGMRDLFPEMTEQQIDHYLKGHLHMDDHFSIHEWITMMHFLGFSNDDRNRTANLARFVAQLRYDALNPDQPAAEETLSNG